MDKKGAGIWNFFQKLSHNCSRKKAELFLGGNISPKSFPTANPKLKEKTAEQKNWSKIYAKKAKQYVPFLKFLPGIRGAAYCNSVALGTAERDSDIDLLIVAAPKKLFTARIFATAYFQLLGRRRHGKKTAGRFCLSFFVTENALDFSPIALQPKDPYLAFWISSLCPIFGREVFEKICKKNNMFVQENAGIQVQFQKNLQKTPLGNSFVRNILEKILGRWFEVVMQKLFKKRMEKKRDLLKDSSGTILSENMLKFHNSDKRHLFV